MIAITPYQVADIAIDTLCKFGGVIPELPSRSVDDDEQAQFVAGVHKGGVLRAVSIPDDFHTCVA